MDWGRAKSILIVALLATNLILLAALALKGASVAEPDDEALLAILASANVSIDGELPKKPGRMAVLYVEPAAPSPSAVDGALAAQAVLLPAAGEPGAALRSAADGPLSKCGIMTEGTRYLGIEATEDGQVVVYGNVFEGIPVEESYVKCYFKDGRFEKIERKWYSPIKLHDKKGEVISPVGALMKLLPEKQEEDPLEIKEVALVYWVSSAGTGAVSPVSDTALPAWRITDGAGRVRYVPGY